MNRTQSKPTTGPKRALVIIWSTFALVSAMVLSGCSGEPDATSLPNETLHPVKGKVVTPDDKPVTEGEITFVPVKTTSRAASGKIGADGSFTLKSGEQGEGAAAGEYRVKISSTLTTGTGKSLKRVVPLEYEDEDASQLKITVKEGSNDLPPIKVVPVKPKKPGRTANLD